MKKNIERIYLRVELRKQNTRKNSKKSVSTAPPVEQFSSKVDRNQFMFG